MAPRRLVTAGEVFGPWTVVRWEQKAWVCRHQDGHEARMTPSTLYQADTTVGEPSTDLTGRTFGELTVLEYIGGRLWRCRCSCGVETNKRGDRMLSGRTSRCGPTNHPTGYRTHPAEYAIWNSMRQRCQNPKLDAFKHYGGRGIKVCPEWSESFDAFLRDVGPRPAPHLTLDRIDNDGNYEPGNVRWATWETQAGNKRAPGPGRRSRLLEHDGRVQTMSQWAREFDLDPGTVHHRLKAGWNLADALTTKAVRLRPY